MFSINIQLTKSGKENVDKVIEAVFAFLGMLRRCKPEERIFNEAKQIKSLGFEYGAEPQPSDNVENLAGRSVLILIDVHRLFLDISKKTQGQKKLKQIFPKTQANKSKT